MLDFRLDTFIAVCKHMNFTHAAQELNITQPAVSQHIKYLQELYGVELFEHSGKKLVLTKAGEYLLNVVTTVKHDDIFLRTKMKEKEMHKVSFGATTTVGQYLLLDKLIDYVKNKEDISLCMNILNTSILLEKIDKGEIDFAMIEGYFDKEAYDYLVYSKEEIIAVCGKEYPLSKDSYTISDLFLEKIILREEGSGSRDIINRYLMEYNYSFHDFKKTIEINNIPATIAFLKANCAIAFLYKKVVEKELKKGKLKQIPITDFSLSHDISLVWRKNSVFAPNYISIFKELKND